MPNSTNENVTYPVTLQGSAYNIIGGYLVILGIFSFVANVLILVVLAKGKPKFHPIHFAFITNIAVSDLVMATTVYPISAFTSFYRRWIWSDEVCKVCGFLSFLLAQNDMNTLAAMTISRYIIICKPQYECYLKQKRVRVGIFGFIWGHSLIITSLPLFGWSRYKLEAFGTACSLDWTSERLETVSYNIMALLLCYILHITIFVFGYLNILKTVKHSANLHQSQQNSVALENITFNNESLHSGHVALMSSAMVFVFLLAWTPYAITSAYVMINDFVPSWVLVVPTMFAKSCTLLNPVVLCLMSSNFRQATTLLFTTKNQILPVNVET